MGIMFSEKCNVKCNEVYQLDDTKTQAARVKVRRSREPQERCEMNKKIGSNCVVTESAHETGVG